MNDSGLPAGDRLDAPYAAPEAREVRAASVIRLGDGSYFRDWSVRGYFSVRSASRDRLFFAGDRDELTRTVAKLARKGVVANVVAVRMLVGQAGGN